MKIRNKLSKSSKAKNIKHHVKNTIKNNLNKNARKTKKAGGGRQEFSPDEDRK